MLLGRAVDVAEERTGLDASEACSRINLDGIATGHVQGHPAVAEREAGDVVTPAPDRQLDPVLGGESHRSDDVVDRCGPNDDRRPLGDHAVPQRHRLRICLVVGAQDGSLEVPGKGLEHWSIQLDAAAIEAGDRK